MLFIPCRFPLSSRCTGQHVEEFPAGLVVAETGAALCSARPCLGLCSFANPTSRTPCTNGWPFRNE